MNNAIALLIVALNLPFTLAQQTQQAPCSTPEYRQFDFWLGEWEVFNPGGQKIAESRILTIVNGCAIQENWLPLRGGGGTSYNAYSSQDKLWHQSWVDSVGTVAFLSGGVKDGKMVMENANKTSRLTWGLVEANPDKVRQVWEGSNDGGKTWSVVFDGLYVRKK